MGFIRTKNKYNGVSSTAQTSSTKYLVHPTLFRHTPSHVRTNFRCGVCSSSEKSSFNMFFWLYVVFNFRIMYAKNSIYSWILLDKNISFLTSSYKKLNPFFKILFELAPVSSTWRERENERCLETGGDPWCRLRGGGGVEMEGYPCCRLRGLNHSSSD